VFSVRAISALLLIFFVPWNTGASAGEYVVSYAIDAGDLNDVGKIDSCEYDKRCVITSNKTRLSIVLRFMHPDHASVELEVDGPPGCCYSADASKTIFLEILPTLQRVPIYEGRPRRRNEFVLNNRFGILYLEFSNMR